MPNTKAVTPKKAKGKAANKEEFFSMKMTDWFIDALTVEEKNAFIDRIKTKAKTVDFHKLSYDDLRKRKFLVKKTKP